MENINIKAFICAVEERLVIWDKRSDEFKYGNKTKAAWQDMCNIQNYEQLTEKKTELGSVSSAHYPVNYEMFARNTIKVFQQSRKMGLVICGPPSIHLTLTERIAHDEASKTSLVENSTVNIPTQVFESSEIFQGFPKARELKIKNSQRKRATSIIPTDTPEKDKIEMKWIEKKKSYNEDEDELSLHDDSDDDVETHVWILEVEPSGFEELDKDPDPNDFVLVQFNAKKEMVFYVGKVVQTENLKNEIEVIFLRKARKFTGHFVFPNIPDISMVSTEDIKMILPPPTLLGSTKRLQSYYKFEINVGSLNMR
ncbi:hypothetical protein RN001_003832 [Aquatica leii]|uniref:MADF domain-containing protein n=1 Tax=Aquatica leii TaxID=1421715 RepID=A0AAN7PPA4_9COLE|nr:hypothetical protein RN001_003832 [Aquatica leii]